MQGVVEVSLEQLFGCVGGFCFHESLKSDASK